MKHRPEIDGLRAVAVVPVVLFHAGLGCPGGFVGVDVFFVISGYLITLLMISDLAEGRFSIVEFWERRVRRILPALALVVFVTLLCACVLFLPEDLKSVGQSVIAQSLLASNMYFWSTTGYFDQVAEVLPLLHTWSLAVEEQFYLLFPLLLMACFRWRRKMAVVALLVLAFLSFGLSAYMSTRHESVNFYWVITRAWELLLGTMIAFLAPKVSVSTTVRDTLAWIGLGMIVLAVLLYDRGTHFPGVTALLPCVGAALVICFAGSQTSAAAILSLKPLVLIGLVSYSLYLWHWPLFVFSRYWALQPIELLYRILIVLASFGMAFLSWKFLEVPFRKRVFLPRRSHLFSAAGAVIGALIVLGVSLSLSKGWPSRLSPAVRRYADATKHRGYLYQATLKDLQNERMPQAGWIDDKKPLELVVWGDSHAMAAMPVIDALCKERQIRCVAITRSSTAPLVGFKSSGGFAAQEDSIALSAAVVDFIRRKHVKNVLLVAKWRGHFKDQENSSSARARNFLEDTVRVVRATGAKVWILKQVPSYPWDVSRALARQALFHRDEAELGMTIAEYRTQAAFESRLFEGLTGATILDPETCLASNTGRCRVSSDGYSLYWGSNHLTIQGAMLLRPLFEPLFEDTGSPSAEIFDAPQ